MPTINPKTAGAVLRLRDFSGIDCRTVLRDTENLRLCADGSLRRRGGYALSLTLAAPIRGLWSGSFRGVESTFAAAGDKLYRLDLPAGRAHIIGDIAAGEGTVALFPWRGQLCCLDGNDILLWDGSTLQAARPYAPLVALDRAPFDPYHVHEPINLISRRARFSFRAPGDVGLFSFGYLLTRVVNLYDEDTGSLIEADEATLTLDLCGNSCLSFSTPPPAGRRIVAVVELDAKYLDYSRIAACTQAVVHNDGQGDRMLCFGGGEASEIFCSRPVSEQQIAEGSVWGDPCGNLYFPMDDRRKLGDGQYALRAACRHEDRLLLFTDGDTWTVDVPSGTTAPLTFIPINSGVGCTAPSGAAQAANNPLTVADGQIWRWSTSALRRDECSAEPISDGIVDRFGRDFSTGARVFAFRRAGEVWFADPSDAAGRVYVYHITRGGWSRFSAICADGFFERDGEICFWRGASLYRFDEARTTDLDTDGEHCIMAVLSLEGIVPNTPERFDHLTRIALHLYGPYPAFILAIATDRGRIQTVQISAGGRRNKATLVDRPLRSGRYRMLSLTLTAADQTPLHLYGLTLTAEPGKR